MVWVEPPLSFKPPGSSPAEVLFKSPVALRKLLQVLSSDRLCPSEVNVPLETQFAPERPLATIVFFNVRLPLVSFSTPPPLLPERVLLVRISVPSLSMPPPFAAVELSETVLLATVNRPDSSFSMPPPFWLLVEELPETVLLVSVSMLSLLMPPPPPAVELSETVLLVTLDVPKFSMPPPPKLPEASTAAAVLSETLQLVSIIIIVELLL